MNIGLPKEIKDNEYRVGLVPAGVHELLEDGSVVWVEANIASMLEDGKVVGRLLVARDITERKRVEEELHSALDQLRAVIGSSPIAMSSPRPRQFDLIAFDWDGTLYDSTAVIVRCIQRADGTVPMDEDEDDLYAICARSY